MFFATCASAMRAFAKRAPFPLLLGCLLLAPPAMADLMLHPTRLVFDKNQRAAQVELINDGTETATYRINLVNRRMTETGDLVSITEPAPGEQFADSMLVFSPRQITLAPGTTQTVRVMVRRPANMAPGEYRSHLHFEKLPATNAVTSVESQAAQGGQQIAIVLNVLVGASIPVIVRQGDTSATVNLSNLALQTGAEGRPQLALQMERSGNASAYGDLAVSFTPKGGNPLEIARIGGIAVYTPNPVRRASIALAMPKGQALAHGTVHVTYRERPDAGGRLIAEASLVLP
ncbi:MAG: molecular chaperone [Massilia sp.]